jgi:AraC-like DNA-binding protein
MKGIRYIDDNFKNIRSVTEVSARVGLSHGYFRSLFKQCRGRKLTDYLQKKRVEKACELLAATNLSISEIAFEVGFNDIPYFTKLFKQELDVTPTQYRQKSRTD